MKHFIVLVAFLAASMAYGDSDSSQKKAESLFKSMTAEQALASNKFTKRDWNRNLPGTSIWMGSTGICLTSQTVETVSPIEICTEWRVDLKDSQFGKDYKSFTAKGAANRFAEDSSNAKGSPYCVASYDNYYSHPLVWQAEQCTLWGVKLKEGASKVKTFKSKVRAQNFAEDSSNAQGRAFCMQKGMVTKSFNTTYKVDFFRKTAHDKYDNKKYLGSHSYTYQSCDNQDLTPVPAN